MADVNQSRLEYSAVDFDGQTTSMSVNGATIADGTAYEAESVKAQALVTALNAIVLGARKSYSFGDFVSDPAIFRSTDNEAQKRVQWIFKFQMTDTGQVRQRSIGTADMSLSSLAFTPQGDGIAVLDLTSTEGAALKTAWDAYVEEEGSSTELLSVYLRQ